MQVFIGAETNIENFSIISAPYGIKNNKLGILGVIGPTPMEYSKVISTVDIAPRLWSLAWPQINSVAVLSIEP